MSYQTTMIVYYVCIGVCIVFALAAIVCFIYLDIPDIIKDWRKGPIYEQQRKDTSKENKKRHKSCSNSIFDEETELEIIVPVSLSEDDKTELDDTRTEIDYEERK